MPRFIPRLKAPAGGESITVLSYIVCRHLGFALITSSVMAADRLCAIVHALPVCKADYVSSCVSERAVRLRASAASFMSVCHPVPGLQWPVAVNSVSLSMMAQAVLRTQEPLACGGLWVGPGDGDGDEDGDGCSSWRLERKWRMQRRAE